MPSRCQRRDYDFNVYTRAKPREKLEYLHAKPVKEKLVAHRRKTDLWGTQDYFPSSAWTPAAIYLCPLRWCSSLRMDRCRWIAQNPVKRPIAEMVAPANMTMSVYHWESATDSRRRNIPARKNAVETRIPRLRSVLMDAWLNPARRSCEKFLLT